MHIALVNHECLAISQADILIQQWNASLNRNLYIHRYVSEEHFLQAWNKRYLFDLILFGLSDRDDHIPQAAYSVRNRSTSISIIFIAENRESLREGYLVNSLHFLTIPLDPNELFRVIYRALALHIENRRELIIEHVDNSSYALEWENVSFIEFKEKTIHCHDALGLRDIILSKKNYLDIDPALFLRLDAMGRIFIHISKIDRITDRYILLKDMHKTKFVIPEDRKKLLSDLIKN